MSEQAITKFLKRNQFHTAMFFWVKALTANMTGLSVEKAVENFIKQNGFLGESPNIQSLVTEYHRINKDYIEIQKS